MLARSRGRRRRAGPRMDVSGAVLRTLVRPQGKPPSAMVRRPTGRPGAGLADAEGPRTLHACAVARSPPTRGTADGRFGRGLAHACPTAGQTSFRNGPPTDRPTGRRLSRRGGSKDLACLRGRAVAADARDRGWTFRARSCARLSDRRANLLPQWSADRPADRAPA